MLCCSTSRVNDLGNRAACAISADYFVFTTRSGWPDQPYQADNAQQSSIVELAHAASKVIKIIFISRTHLLVEGLGLESLDDSGNPGLRMGDYVSRPLHRLQVSDKVWYGSVNGAGQ